MCKLKLKLVQLTESDLKLSITDSNHDLVERIKHTKALIEVYGVIASCKYHFQFYRIKKIFLLGESRILGSLNFGMHLFIFEIA